LEKTTNNHHIIKKVVFIEPRPPDPHVFSRYKLPRLGCVVLGTIIEQKGRYCKVFIEDIADIDFKEVFAADLVGITTITSTAPRAYAIADQIRKAGIPVVMGGPHVTFLPDEALEHSDYVIRGEAEESFPELLDTIEAGRGIEDINGLSFRIGDRNFHNPGMGRVKNLDDLPLPDFSMVHGGLKGKVWPMQTSRGCPFNCNFCTVTQMFGRAYRFRSKEHIMRELRAVPKDKLVFFYDDNFAADRNRAKDLMRMMIAEGITPKWTTQVRVDVARDPEMIDLMKASGCVLVYIGFESVNPETLKAFHKGQSLEEMKKSIQALHGRGIRIHGMFVLGADDDDKETLDLTVDFAKQQKIDTVQFLILAPLPGTAQLKQFQAEDRILIKDWSYYDAHHVVYEPKKMTFFELQAGVFKAFMKFYNRTGIIKAFFSFKIINIIYKVYAYRLVRGWLRRNKEFVRSTKQWTRDAKALANVKVRRVADDITERIRKHSAKGEIPKLSQSVEDDQQLHTDN